MFLKIKRINRKGEEKENLINTNNIVGIIELNLEPERFYDEYGNVVKTEERTDKEYKLFVSNGLELKITEETYNELCKVLG